ncbi:MAG: DNA topoisomerase IV subunit B [Firmicutes bacterium]|nr:DNA topoisomerase IV subunit B [Bacillota bacterium]
MAKQEYNENSIKILEGLDAVRKRPGMYIGSTDKRGMHHLIWEIVDNGIDEVINGYGNYIKIILEKDGSITIADNGRGVPVGMHASGKSTPEVIYTILHAGGKFEEGGYKVSGGLHGVGASVVNALSSWMVVTIYRDGKISQIKFKDGGKVDSKLKEIGKTNKTGTIVQFMPDKEIFKNCNFSFTTICERMQESAFLNPNLTVEVIDVEDNLSAKYHYETGLTAFVEYVNEGHKALHKVVQFNNVRNRIDVAIALQYTDTYNEQILSFVNDVKTGDGGSHEVGFKSGLTKAFNEYAKNNNIVKGNSSLTGDDLREGLSAIISVRIPEDILQFEGQTKGKLGTPEAKQAVEQVIYENLKFYLEENKEIAKTILEKADKSRQAREAARKARESVRKGDKTKNNRERIISEKLAKATSKEYSKNELFLVEGDSAGGSAKSYRDREHQAILPLRGKVLNTEKASSNDIENNAELRLIEYAIGAGLGQDFDVKESNYGKVIIMTDADVDGSHIQILLITFFYKFMRPLIENGMLYIATPPLYSVETGAKGIKEYIATDEELEEKKKTLKGNYKLQRFKGLGEMNADELYETTMSPKNRRLIRVTLSDAALAEKRIHTLMGDEVAPRKAWINENVDFTLEDDFRK